MNQCQGKEKPLGRALRLSQRRLNSSGAIQLKCLWTKTDVSFLIIAGNLVCVFHQSHEAAVCVAQILQKS